MSELSEERCDPGAGDYHHPLDRIALTTQQTQPFASSPNALQLL